MIKKFVKHGNSWAIVIDRPILDLLKISPDQPVELSTDGKTMTIAPVSTADDKSQVRGARKKINARYRKAFQKLAE